MSEIEKLYFGYLWYWLYVRKDKVSERIPFFYHVLLVVIFKPFL